MNRTGIAFIAILGSAPAYAQVVFTNFGSAPPGYEAYGWNVSNTTGNYQEAAMEFTPDASVLLTSVDLALGYASNQAPENFSLSVYADIAGAPGSLLGTSGVESANHDVASDLQSYDLSALNISLVAGKQYWLDARPASGSVGTWNETDRSGSSTLYFKGAAGGSFGSKIGTSGAFDIVGTPVPEPKGFIGVFGAVGLLSAAKRRRK